VRVFLFGRLEIIRSLALLVALLFAVPAAALTIKADLNFDGSWSTLYRAGDKPIGGGDTCPAGFTCGSLGTTQDCQFSSSSGTQVTITATTQGDQYGVCAAYKTFAMETNRRVEYQITGITGNQATYAGGGGFVGDDDADYSTPDYKIYAPWLPVVGQMRVKSDVGGAGQAGQYGVASITAPRYGSFEYNATSNSTTGWESANNWTTDLLIGTAVSHTFTAGRYGVFCTSASTDASSTCAFSNLGDSTTLANVDGSSPPPTSDTPDYDDPLDGVSMAGGRRDVSAANASALSSALSAALCGDNINLSAGTYSGNYSLSVSCDADEPIIIKGAASFATTLSGRLTMTGARNTVTGILFSGANSGVTISGTNNHVLANKFTAWKNIAVRPEGEVTPGTQGEIAYNEFYAPADWDADAGCGVVETGDGCQSQSRFGIRMGTSSSFSSVHTLAWVHHNYFHDIRDKPNANFRSGQSDAVEIGESGYAWTEVNSCAWHFEDNLIYDHRQVGEAAVDVKCSGTIFRRNTLTNSPNTRFDFRLGSGSTFESNYNDTGGGDTVHGGNQKLYCNYANGPVKLKSGDILYTTVASPHTGHPNVHNAHLAKNRFLTVNVGHYSNAAEKTYPANLVLIEEHLTTAAGTAEDPEPAGHGIDDSNDSDTNGTNTTNNANSASSVNCVPAVKLEAGQVGPSALSSASAAYLDARVP
jgi:hypothetical protein